MPVFLFLSGISYAGDTAYEITAAVKSYPFSGSVVASIKKEFELWDQRSGQDPSKPLWKYGYIRPQIDMAAHGMLLAGLTVAPISLLELGYFQSRTQRFYKIHQVDCDLTLCGGIVDREVFSVRLLTGYDSYLLIPQYQWVRSSIEDSSKALADEVENLVLTPGGDKKGVTSVFLGKQWSVKTLFGLVYRQVEFRDSQVENRYVGLAIRQTIKENFEQLSSYKVKDAALSFSLGSYESDSTRNSISAVVAGSVIF